MRFKGAETYLASWSFIYAVILAIPVDTFSAVPVDYMSMSRIASELVWAGIFAVLFLVQFLGMYFNNRKLKQVGLIAATFFWVLVGFSYLLSNIQSATVTVAGFLHIATGMFAGWLYQKVGGQR